MEITMSLFTRAILWWNSNVDQVIECMQSVYRAFKFGGQMT